MARVCMYADPTGQNEPAPFPEGQGPAGWTATTCWDENPDNPRGDMGNGGGGKNSGIFGGTRVINLEPDRPPNYVYTKGYKSAIQKAMDNAKWKRQQLKSLLKMYRQQLPQQISAYRDAAMGAMPEKEKDMWGQMYSSLGQRGLSDSASFLGGARNDFENWKVGELQGIEDTAQAMKQQGQQAMLSALGQPNFAGLASQWGQHNQQLNDFFQNQWKNYMTARQNKA